MAETVTVSSDFRVEIPVAARESLNIQPGQKIRVMLYNNRIELIPVTRIEDARGFLEGISTRIEREKDRL